MSNKKSFFLIAFILLLLFTPKADIAQPIKETKTQKDKRMKWWREARFGMFIHWGLYAIPAGEWNGEKNHAEWIRHTAHIPIDVYDKLVDQFNPVKFDADEWVKMAKDAGMKYIVITSKHHDGFCLFDSKYTDFDIMSTPFKRDIMKELADACRKQGLKICWYHSIMDWHHPDYLPRRNWEKEIRPADGANFDRYVQHLKNQVRELLTNYGPIGVMWFDGEWEETWNHEYGVDLYNFCREIQPDVIVNNRVDKGRGGLAGMTKDESYVGDFGTPEQEIPATGIPGVDWETCMTMNNHWGYNKFDKNFKSTKDLLRKLADIASKSGNFLLNVGPKADGTFPQESIDRLREIGQWMKVNGEAIYGTQASPFPELEWGRCTQKTLKNGDTRLYLHVFDWPENGKLVVHGIFNQAKQAYLLVDETKKSLPVSRLEDALVIEVPKIAPDTINSVIVLDIEGKPDVSIPPNIEAENDIFINSLEVKISSDRENVEIHYTTDGKIPTLSSPKGTKPIHITETTLVKARLFRDGKPVSGVSERKFTRVTPMPAMKIGTIMPGTRYAYFVGNWDRLPDFFQLEPKKTGVLDTFSFSPRDTTENFGFRYSGYIKIPADGVYAFFTNSDDGSKLYIDYKLVVDNDGLHGAVEKKGVIPLKAGLHRIMVTFFERTGGDVLKVFWKKPGEKKVKIPADVLFY